MALVRLIDSTENQNVMAVASAVCRALGYPYMGSDDDIGEFDPRTNSWRITLIGEPKTWEVLVRRADAVVDLWFAVAFDGHKMIPLRVGVEAKSGWIAEVEG